MNKPFHHAAGSLIERAAEAFDLYGHLRVSGGDNPETEIRESWLVPAPPVVSATLGATIDRAHLREMGFIIPGAAPNAISEEFRIAKRHLLLAALGGRNAEPVGNGRLILVCSSQADEGKTFCAINLALSMASETDIEVLLVDADVAKPAVLSTLDLPERPGLMDALSDPSIDPEQLVIRTDIPNLSILPAGRHATNDTELLASDRTPALIDGLAARNPRRIVLFDSAPALAASAASVLAMHMGQIVMVVRADRTSERDLRDALHLVDSCPNIRLLMNGVSFRGSNRKFGSYYDAGA